MKKIKLSILMLIFILGLNPSYSLEKGEFFQIYEAKNFIKQHNNALKKHDIEKIKTFYAKDYKNSDGFTTENLGEMLKKTYGAYDIKYKIKVNNISLYDDVALIELSDKTKAKIRPNGKNTPKNELGNLKGKSSYAVYLKKNEEGMYKIVSDDVLMEEISLKYGIANKLKINLETPIFAENGKNYDLKLNMNKPNDVLALASLSREEIVYPPLDYAEKYRKIPQDGALERIVKANNKNRDEYAIASIGFTKVSFNEEETQAKIEILGTAYIMKRININKTFEESKKL